MTRIAIDPITRIEGHLRIEVEVADGKVTKAWSSSTMFRGIEEILKGQGSTLSLDNYTTHLRCLNDCTRSQLRASC